MRRWRASDIRSGIYGVALGATLGAVLMLVSAMPGSDTWHEKTAATWPALQPAAGGIGADRSTDLAAACRTFSTLSTLDAEDDYTTRTRRIALFCPELMRFFAEREAGSKIADAAAEYGRAVIAAHDDLMALGPDDVHYVARDWILRTHEVDRHGIAWAMLRAAEIQDNRRTEAIKE